MWRCPAVGHAEQSSSKQTLTVVHGCVASCARKTTQLEWHRAKVACFHQLHLSTVHPMCNVALNNETDQLCRAQCRAVEAEQRRPVTPYPRAPHPPMGRSRKCCTWEHGPCRSGDAAHVHVHGGGHLYTVPLAWRQHLQCPCSWWHRLQQSTSTALACCTATLESNLSPPTCHLSAARSVQSSTAKSKLRGAARDVRTAQPVLHSLPEHCQVSHSGAAERLPAIEGIMAARWKLTPLAEPKNGLSPRMPRISLLTPCCACCMCCVRCVRCVWYDKECSAPGPAHRAVNSEDAV